MSVDLHAIIFLIGGDVPRILLAQKSSLLQENAYFMCISLISAKNFTLNDSYCLKLTLITKYFGKNWQIRHKKIKKIFSYKQP